MVLMLTRHAPTVSRTATWLVPLLLHFGRRARPRPAAQHNNTPCLCAALQAQEEARRKGEAIPEGEQFDSNCITPGTPFMARLGRHLRFFIRKKMSEDVVWQAPTVVFSGHEVPGKTRSGVCGVCCVGCLCACAITAGSKALRPSSVPAIFTHHGRITRTVSRPRPNHMLFIVSLCAAAGEGEHKIMEHIRWQKRQPGYQPNQRHVMYGLDADLIMLSLVTHEPHFCLLREVVSYSGRGRGQPAREALENPCAENLILFQIGCAPAWATCALRDQPAAVVCNGVARKLRPCFRRIIPSCSAMCVAAPARRLLREYFELDFAPLAAAGFPIDVERIVDDFVLFCMLVGNDFLPPLPTLDIAEGALNNLISCYKELLPVMGGYLTCAGARRNGHRLRHLSLCAHPQLLAPTLQGRLPTAHIKVPV